MMSQDRRTHLLYLKKEKQVLPQQVGIYSTVVAAASMSSLKCVAFVCQQLIVFGNALI